MYMFSTHLTFRQFFLAVDFGTFWMVWADIYMEVYISIWNRLAANNRFQTEWFIGL